MRLKRAVFVMAALFVLLAGSLPASHAALQRVGPIDPANGYPLWYQDTTGLTLDNCMILNQAEADGGWCLLLP
ncbi:MAG: hypothetical protein HY712_03685, partial [candidate division NC10 bacterium]|nr:hypothetical protein [candidate division NC10 bacterium]